MEAPRHIGREIKALNNQIKRVMDGRLGQFAPNDDGPTGVQGMIIGYLYYRRDQDVYQRDVEAEFHIRRSTATGILQLLEKKGVIERLPVPSDARLKKLVLTPKALAVHEQIAREIEAMEAQLVQGLTPEEVDAFFHTIKKMRRNIE